MNTNPLCCLIGRNFVGRKWRIVLKIDEHFARPIVSSDQIINIFLNDSLLGSFVLQLKTLLILLVKTILWAKVTNFSFSDENFAWRIVSPDKVLDLEPTIHYNVFMYFRKILLHFGPLKSTLVLFNVSQPLGVIMTFSLKQ